MARKILGDRQALGAIHGKDEQKTFVTDQRAKQDFAELLRFLSNDEYPGAEKILLVTDNLNTHSPAYLYEKPAEARRLAQLIGITRHEHGSWLNMAEIELSVLSRQYTNPPISRLQKSPLGESW